MSNEAELELQMAGLKKQYDYTEFAHTNHVNVIPEKDFKRLVSDTFNTITYILKQTYGPYGSSGIISDQSETTTTKDGYNVFQAIGPNHAYKRKVYLAINKIITRVNRTVGDGTTSCILLAEKIFNNLNNLINTPDEKRVALELLTEIEKNLQDNSEIERDVELKIIKKVDPTNIKALISVAANYDDELVDVLYNAFKPTVDEDGNVVVRTVIPRSEVDIDAGSNAEYTIDYLPGDYRINAFSDIDTSAKFNHKRTMKVVMYDHSFNSTDWINFTKNWNRVDNVLILARDFNKSFINQDYRQYIGDIEFRKKSDPKNNHEPKVHLFWVGGNHKQDELKDLAAVLGTEVRDMNALEVDFEEIPTVTMSLYKNNCLAFYDVKGKVDTTHYVDSLKADLANDESHSYVRLSEYKKRIKAIRMESEDTLLTVKAGTSLEAKIIMDKIDDCVHIVESGLNSGLVPNLFRYVHDRLGRIRYYSENSFLSSICEGMQNSIYGLFEEIWCSKYGSTDKKGKNDTSITEHMSIHYGEEVYSSFNIIDEVHTDLEKFSTSAQYDLEVTVASIAIVKYLLTSRFFIFDANLLQPVNDEGHYA